MTGASTRVEQFQVAVIQASPVVFDRDRTLTKVATLAARAASKGAQLVLFLEAFVSAYPRGLAFGSVIGSRTDQGREDFQRYWESSVDIPGPSVDALAETALSANQFNRRRDFPADYHADFGDEPEGVVNHGGSCIVDPFGNLLAGPDTQGESILMAGIDRPQIVRGKFDLDVVGHYARPDIFELHVDERPKTSVTSNPSRTGDAAVGA